MTGRARSDRVREKNGQILGDTRVTRKGLIALALVGGVGALSACDRDVIFQGKRENIYSPDPAIVGEDAAAAFVREQAEAEANVTRAVSLPGMSSLGSWTQVAANAQNNVPHVAFSSAPQVIFNTDFGQGSTRKYKITAEPVIAGGQVFVMDSQSTVAALTTGGASGERGSFSAPHCTCPRASSPTAVTRARASSPSSSDETPSA